MSRLRILLYVPAQTDAVGIHHELTTRLAECLSGSVDASLATSNDKKVSTAPADYDLIHIFGCWSNSACQLAGKAYTQRTPYVLTPLGMLQPWENERHRQTPLFKRQHLLTARAAAVQVCGQLEQTTFQKLDWNPRIALIKNPVLTSLTTFEQTAAQLLQLYRMVLDSNVRILLNADTQQLLGLLLQMGIDEAALEDEAHRQTVAAALTQLNDEQWRRMVIYASDEKLSAILSTAMQRLGVVKPMPDVAAISRFKTKSSYTEGHLSGDALLSRNLLLRNKVKEVFAEHAKTEKSVCLQLLNLHYELSRHTAPLLHLTDLYRTMRFTDMDEDAVSDMAKALDIFDFGERLMAVMHQLLGLTEGFMPFNSRDDRQTKRLSTALTKFGVYPQ